MPTHLSKVNPQVVAPAYIVSICFATARLTKIKLGRRAASVITCVRTNAHVLQQPIRRSRKMALNERASMRPPLCISKRTQSVSSPQNLCPEKFEGFPHVPPLSFGRQLSAGVPATLARFVNVASCVVVNAIREMNIYPTCVTRRKYP